MSAVLSSLDSLDPPGPGQAQPSAMAENSVLKVRQHMPVERHHKVLGWGLAMVVSTLLLYGGVFLAALWVPWLSAKLALGTLAGLCIGVVFVVGHDASHGNLSNSPALNRWLARLAFLPSAHPNETWDTGHNRLHHSWTNLAPLDPGYPPFSPQAFAALPAWERALHRASRTLPGIGLAYLIIWWQDQIRIHPAQRKLVRSITAFHLERLAILAFALLQLGAVAHWGAWSAQPGWQGLALEWLLCVAWPYYIWNATMAFVTLLHHTHPKVRWFADQAEWSYFKAQVAGTVHVVWPRWFGWAFHNIFEHTAHHADKHIPLYRLEASQQALEAAYPSQVIVQKGSLTWVLKVLRSCQLYDYGNHQWLNWKGQVVN
jgi:omega-6 fatty acid desaturase (delta-12 desaturase)